MYLIGEKNQQKVTNFLVVTNIFPRLKLTPTKNLYQLLFLLYKNQITEILKKLSDLLYHNLVERRWVGKGS